MINIDSFYVTRFALALSNVTLLSMQKSKILSTKAAHTKPDPIPKLECFKELLNKDSNILDVGCGNGKNCVYLTQQGYKLTGIDISDYQINIAKESNKRNIIFDVGDMTNLPYESCSFSGAFCTYSLEASEYEKTLKEIARILKKDGYFIIVSLYKIEYHHFKPFNFEISIGNYIDAIRKYFNIIEKELDSYKESDRYGLNTKYRIKLILQKNKEH